MPTPLNASELNSAHAQIFSKPRVNVENTLKEVFTKFPDHKNLEGVITKIVVLNQLYAVNVDKVTDIVVLAEKICNIPNIDTRLQNGCHELVNEIANLTDKHKIMSFASKYCCIHNFYVYDKDDYSIIDSTVKKLLPHYAKQVGIKTSTQQLKNYQRNFQYDEICKIIDSTLQANHITTQQKRRDFDFFLWLQR